MVTRWTETSFRCPITMVAVQCSRADFSAGHAIYRQSAVEGYDRRMGTHGAKAQNES
jgi:hypothetical protein